MTITAPTPITTLPTPVPQTSDPADFDTRADAFLTALPNFGDQTNAAGTVTYNNALAAFTASSDATAAAAVASAATQLVAFSTSNLVVAAGTLTIAFTSPKTGFAVNDQVVIVLRSDTTIKMFGTVATFDGSSNMTVTVISSGVFGAGTFASWIVASAAFLTQGATAAQIWAATSDAVAATPKSFGDAAAPVALTDGATITADLSTGANFTVTLGGNRTLANPTNPLAGKSGIITVKQDATGSRTLAYGTGWKFPGGTPAVSTAANAVDTIAYYVEDAATPIIRAVMAKAYS